MFLSVGHFIIEVKPVPCLQITSVMRSDWRFWNRECINRFSQKERAWYIYRYKGQITISFVGAYSLDQTLYGSIAEGMFNSLSGLQIQLHVYSKK